MTDVQFLEDCRPRERRERAWWLEFDCDGVPFTWRGNARTDVAAEETARHELAARCGTFNRHTARLTACLER